jgi:hypothetical protein
MLNHPVPIPQIAPISGLSRPLQSKSLLQQSLAFLSTATAVLLHTSEKTSEL